jgi:hypothetical protein
MPDPGLHQHPPNRAMFGLHSDCATFGSRGASPLSCCARRKAEYVVAVFSPSEPIAHGWITPPTAKCRRPTDL